VQSCSADASGLAHLLKTFGFARAFSKGRCKKSLTCARCAARIVVEQISGAEFGCANKLEWVQRKLVARRARLCQVRFSASDHAHVRIIGRDAYEQNVTANGHTAAAARDFRKRVSGTQLVRVVNEDRCAAVFL
jgi:hypothetical protein